MKVKPETLAGFTEYLPQEQIKFNNMVSAIKTMYACNGFLPMDTPVLERADVLLAKSGGETDKQIYRLTKEDVDIAMRFDLTVPLARYVAKNMSDLAFPFKRYQLGKVYRGEKNQKGRYREFYQFDIDIVGNEKLDIKNDAIVINMIYKALKEVTDLKFTIKVSNRKLLQGLLEELGIEDSYGVLSTIDKYDKIGKDSCYKILEDKLNKEQLYFITQMIECQKIEDIMQIQLTNQTIESGVTELTEIFKVLSMLGVDTNSIQLDTKITRGLDYYTGTIFETTLDSYENYGSIASGGRYDNLAENYINTKLPGVGASIGMTRLFSILKEIGVINLLSNVKMKYLIIPIGNTYEKCYELMNYFQFGNTIADVYLEGGSLKKKMEYANKIGAENVVLVGEDEIAKGAVTIRNMQTGEQSEFKIR